MLCTDRRQRQRLSRVSREDGIGFSVLVDPGESRRALRRATRRQGGPQLVELHHVRRKARPLPARRNDARLALECSYHVHVAAQVEVLRHKPVHNLAVQSDAPTKRRLDRRRWREPRVDRTAKERQRRVVPPLGRPHRLCHRSHRRRVARRQSSLGQLKLRIGGRERRGRGGVEHVDLGVIHDDFWCCVGVEEKNKENEEGRGEETGGPKIVRHSNCHACALRARHTGAYDGGERCARICCGGAMSYFESAAIVRS